MRRFWLCEFFEILTINCTIPNVIDFDNESNPRTMVDTPFSRAEVFTILACVAAAGGGPAWATSWSPEKP